MVAEMTQVPMESVTEVHKSLAQDKGKQENGPGKDELINFGTHGVGEAVKGEETNSSNIDILKDAAEEWPTPKEIHHFYFIRQRPYEDPKIKAKIEQTEKEIQRRNNSRVQLLEELRAKRAEKGELAAQQRSLKTDWRNCRSAMEEKKKEMEPLQQALGKLRNNVRSGGICSSEEELNDLIHSLQYRIQHESIPLSEEKQLLREIKQLEGTREKVMANAAMRAKIQESMGQKEAIQDQVKLMGVDLDGVRKENQAVWLKISQLDGKVKALDEEIRALQEELQDVNDKHDKAFANLHQLRKQRAEANANFFQYRTISNQAKALAFKKDVNAMKELLNAEVEKFMTLWNSNKAFRDDYETRLLPSLDMRQLSRDARIRNPDEKPLVAVETSLPSQPEIVKPNVKQSKGDSKSSSQKDTQNIQKEATNKEIEKRTVEHKDAADIEITVVEKPAPEKKVDEAKLKEMKKEEDRAKALEGMERKRKKEEAKAAKAAQRAQREAERQLKEREKKAKKKIVASGTDTNEESAEADTDGVEAENSDASAEAPVEAPTPAKPKFRKENTVKHRSRPRGPESLPKTILKRKKSSNYWVWAAAIVVLLILVLVYYYYLQ